MKMISVVPAHGTMGRMGLMALLFVFASIGKGRCEEPVDDVNPFIGSGSQGKTFPGAATPYGLVQLSPDSITGGDYGSGYNWEHTTLQGFSFTHMSGVGWHGDLGNFLVTPTTGPLKTSYGETDKPGTGYLSRKAEETATAGYYAVTLMDYQIRAELTAAPHSGILRFTYPKDEHARIQIDLARRVGGTAVQQSVKVVDDNAIEGWMRCTPEGGGWGNGVGKPNYTVFFHAEFSRPLKEFGVWSVDIPDGERRKHAQFDANFVKAMEGAKILAGCRKQEGKHLGFCAEFPTQAGEQILLKTGISFVSIAGARDNLRAEIPGWDFDGVRGAARGLWARELSRIAVEGGTARQRTAFYTALYHAMIDPRAFADVNGSYPGGDGKPHKTDSYTRRTIFSGWDVYRSAYPLMTLIAPKVVTDMINSLLDLAVERKKDYLERWEFLNAYSGCMNGNPAVPVIVDAYKKGLRGFDVDQAYALSRNSCEHFGNGRLGYTPNKISHTLEQGFDEWCLSELAGAPWLTQKWVRLICEKAYGSDVYGLCGDEDVGQMSAWFVLAACGIHQACPGDTRYELFTPLFDKVHIRIDPVNGAGKTFDIVTRNNGPGPRYIQSAKLNGQPLDRCWLDHERIVAGGLLELELGDSPNEDWGCDTH